MQTSRFTVIVVLLAALATAGCANTIRGAGKDTANAVNATEQAGKTVAKAVN